MPTQRRLARLAAGTHSVIAALEEARAARGRAATVWVVPLVAGQVKVIARDAAAEVVFYTECSAADAEAILDALADDLRDITAVVNQISSGGLDLLAAAQAACRALAPPAR